MVRFLHTADWQLGLKLRFVPGDRGARARLERFEVVRRIAAEARARGVDAVVVAGDVFDDNAVGADTVQAARDALAAFAPVPVLLLPGNHDAATPDCVLRRLDAGPHVRVLLDEAPVEVGGAVFLPCPLPRRQSADDPTRRLPAREAGDHRVRVAIAHGGLLDFGETTETPNRIDGEAALAKGIDYLALGDWHGRLGFGPRVWYPGAPEATRFKEKDPGWVLDVTVEEAGATPRVDAVRVARTRWEQWSETLAGPEDVARLDEALAALPERSWTLVELTLRGALSPEARGRLDAALLRHGDELLHLRVDADGVKLELTEEDRARLGHEPFLGRAVGALEADGSDEALDALRLLYRLAAEEGA